MHLSLIHLPHKINESKGQGYDKNQSSPAAIKRRSERNKARRRMEKAGRVKKGDGKHVHHKKALSNGGSNSDRNLSITSAKENWGEGRKVSAAHQRKKK